MTSARHWLQIFLAGCVWTQVSAQTGTTGATGGGTTTGGTSGTSSSTTGSGTSGRTAPKNAPTESDPLFPSGTTGGTGTTTGGTGATKPAGGTTSPAGQIEPPAQTPSDPFGFGNPLTPAGPTAPFGQSGQPGASSTFGTEPRNARPSATPTETAEPAAAKTPEAPAPSYNVPSFYGASRQVLTAGEGRLARPRFRYHVSAGIGFDDNTQQTPDNQEDIPEQVVTQVVSPAEPEIAVFQTQRVQTGTIRFQGGAGFVPVYKNVTKKIVLRPAIPEQTVETVIPGVDFGERNASVVSRIDGRVDAQWANSRGLFVLDGRLGAEYYWNRDQDPLEFNGSLGATYIRRLGPKMQFSGNLSLSYQSQPDYSQVNLVDTAGSSGSYFAGNIKLDLSYRWAPRFSTVTSLTGNTILYEGTRTTSNYWEAGFGNEFRWIQSPKTTWIAELRYTELQYLEGVQSAISTAFLLLGADWTFSRKLRSTVRIGESVRTFETGGNASTPYGEVSLVYQPNRREQFNFTGRYGFEQTASASDENIVGRFSLGYSRTFNPRLVGSLSANYVRNNITSAGGAESTNEVIDGSLVFQYMFTRKFSMNARYSYTLSTTSAGFSDYDRSRFYLTGEYEF